MAVTGFHGGPRDVNSSHDNRTADPRSTEQCPVKLLISAVFCWFVFYILVLETRVKQLKNTQAKNNKQRAKAFLTVQDEGENETVRRLIPALILSGRAKGC